MSWTPRTSAPPYGTPPYDWNAQSRGQCTWYAYWRVQEEGYSPPCWYSGSGSSGSGYYTNAALWLQHYRTPWEVKGPGYQPVAGDLAVFTTRDPAGHVCVIESITSSTMAKISDYNINLDESFSYRDWRIGGGIGSTGVLIGYLHYPDGPTPPGPTPSEQLTISISPAQYNEVIDSGETYLDFTFAINISGIPANETVSGGNTYPGLERVYNTGWTYNDYVIDGITYRSADKTQTLRYHREGLGAYNTVKYMYYNINKSTGAIDSQTPMYITVEPAAVLMALMKKIRKRGNRAHVQFKQ